MESIFGQPKYFHMLTRKLEPSGAAYGKFGLYRFHDLGLSRVPKMLALVTMSQFCYSSQQDWKQVEIICLQAARQEQGKINDITIEPGMKNNAGGINTKAKKLLTRKNSISRNSKLTESIIVVSHISAIRQIVMHLKGFMKPPRRITLYHNSVKANSMYGKPLRTSFK